MIGKRVRVWLSKIYSGDNLALFWRRRPTVQRVRCYQAGRKKAVGREQGVSKTAEGSVAGRLGGWAAQKIKNFV